jgi:acetylornithine/succinyldiaminopimelate/putrescine aminotransferase
MEREVVVKISKQIYRQFPEVSKNKPVVKPQGDNYLFVFKGSAVTASGHKIDRNVRVVADRTGRIMKVTTSR